jgi:glycosyltransferase involved in cell wall biosynthesis
MARFARERRVFYIEEPIYGDGAESVEVSEVLPNLRVCTPHVAHGTSEAALRALLHRFLSEHGAERPLLWLYTPMMLPLIDGLTRRALVYDCMDELSLFLNAPPELLEREAALLREADLVFTGGQSLYEKKRTQHPRVYPFPSSVDVAHFRGIADLTEPGDQRELPHPRIGFFGVIDERMNLSLMHRVAEERPEYHFILIGPVVKISESDLPRAANLHYLGPKTYNELPAYLAFWDVAIMPFALNDATRFISPTKTLEYLAAGKPIVSTAIRDVVRPYGEQGVVQIAGIADFSSALDEALAGPTTDQHARAEAILSSTSWDATWRAMDSLLNEVEAAAIDSTKEQACLTT